MTGLTYYLSMRYKIVSLAAIILAISTMSCQKEYDLLDPKSTGKWEVFNSGNVLPGDYINDVFVDKNDNLWVAVNGQGVTFYNGDDWITYNTSNSGILNNYVNCIEQDANGDMWFGTNDGISFLVDGSVWYYFQDPNVVYKILSLKKDRNGWVWIGTEGESFLYYDGTGFYTGADWPVEDLNTVNTIEEDEFGRIWFGTNMGITIWNGSSWDWKSSLDGLTEDVIWSLYLDSKDRMWIGTGGGTSLTYSEGGVFKHLSLFNGMNYEFMVDICEDAGGDIWIATWFHGLIRYDGVTMQSFKEYEGFPNDDLEAIVADRSGNIWVGTFGSGVAKYSLPVKF